MKKNDHIKNLFTRIIQSKSQFIEKYFKYKSNLKIDYNYEGSLENKTQIEMEEQKFFQPISILNFSNKFQEKLKESANEHNEGFLFKNIFDDFSKEMNEDNELMLYNNDDFDCFYLDDFSKHSPSIWIIEAIEPENGGILKWNEIYRFKHFYSGKYLAILNKTNVF